MKKVFITYCHEDAVFVEKLWGDLSGFDIDVFLDKKIISPGNSLIEIFGHIGKSNALLPVLSKTSVQQPWVQKELRVGITKSIEEESFEIVPIIHPDNSIVELKSAMPKDLLEAMRDIYMCDFNARDYKDALSELAKTMKRSGDIDPEQTYVLIQGKESDNPFRRVRTEYFESSELLATMFARPESTSYDRAMETKPTLIEGGRGSGKSMFLKSLQSVVAVYLSGKDSFNESRLTYYGCYCKLSRGSFSTDTTNIEELISVEKAEKLFNFEMILKLILTLIEELVNCRERGMLNIPALEEEYICQKIGECVDPYLNKNELPKKIDDLRRLLGAGIRKISDYITNVIINDHAEYAGFSVDKDVLMNTCRIISGAVSDLKKCTIYFLLDEYENLHEFQKVVLNTLIKCSENGGFSIKVASKTTGFRNSSTIEGQELEENHDYKMINLDYDLSNNEHRSNYKKLLMRITTKILDKEGCRETDIRKILVNNEMYDGIDKKDIEKEVIEIVENNHKKKWSNLPANEKQDYFDRLGYSCIYRLLHKTRKTKKFGGFDDMALLSSGIARCFLELCGMAYFYAVKDGNNVKTGDAVSIKNQTEAIHSLSAYYYSNIKKNIARDGARLQLFIMDIGDIFKHKLLHHLSEPEAARITIADPQLLLTDNMKTLNDCLTVLEMHSLFQIQRCDDIGGMRPKNSTKLQPKEYAINRLFAPLLEFSPRVRWRTEFNCRELDGLLNTHNRDRIKTTMMNKVVADIALNMPRLPLNNDQ